MVIGITIGRFSSWLYHKLMNTSINMELNYLCTMKANNYKHMKWNLIKLTLLLSFFIATGLKAQDSTQNEQPLHKRNIFTLGLYKQPGLDSMVDFVDGLYRVLNINKVRSLGEKTDKLHYTYVPGIEYSLATGFATSISASVVLPYKNLLDNQSIISSELKYTQNKQIIAQVVSNLWLNKNEYNITTNWSYLKYPQTDYGLGANSTLKLFDNLDYSYLKLHQSILKRMSPNLYFGPGLDIDYHWNITDTTTKNKPVVGFNEYGFSKHSSSVGILLNLLYDSRKSLVSPIANSSYFNLVYRDNTTFLGSDVPWQTLMLDYRKYLPFPMGSKNILAFWSYNVFTLGGKQPYLDLPATASDTYNNTGRGYIQGRFRGDKLVYAESEYRFGITENGFLGGVLFANMQSISESQGKPLQSILPGYGAGIRIKLNKHSNTNIAIDYGIGQGGSKGIFMNLGEVF